MSRSKMNIIFALLFFLSCTRLTAQLEALKTWTDQVTEVQHIPSFKSAQRYIQSQQLDSALYHLTLLDSTLQQNSLKEESIALNLLLGKIYCTDLQAYEQAKKPLKQALKQISKNDQSSTYLEAVDLLTASFYWLFQSEEAFQYAIEGLDFSKNIENGAYELTFTQWMGKILAIQGELGKALEYYAKGLELALKTDDPLQKYEAYLNIGCCSYKNKQPEKGLAYLANCTQYLNEIDQREKRQADVWMWSGIMNVEIAQYEQGISLLTQALPVFDRLNIPNRRMHTRLELGKAYLREGKNRDAIKIIEETLQLDVEKITPFEQKFAYTLLHQSNRNIDNYQQAILHLESLNRVNAQLDSINNAKNIQELEQKYKDKEQQQLIDKQKIIIQRGQWLKTVLALMSILFLGTIALLYFLNKNRIKLARQKATIEAQTKELQQLDQLKSNFFANVSHELRTPLTLLLGPIGSVLKSGDLDQRNFSLLQKAQQSGKELLKMVSSILDLSKLEAQKMEVDWQPVLLFPLVRRISTNFESQAESKQIQYTFNYRAEGDLFVEIDQEKLSIFLKNLLSNAIKFTPANGKVRMIVEDLGNKIQFTVKDTGRGIPDEDVAHVFDRFYQTKQANKAVEGGTGIGLALCKEYTQLMGGDITVKSQLNIGSTFIATIARREVLQATPNMVDMESSDILTPSSLAPKVNPSNHTATSILVVEDNSSLRDYLYTILSPHYRVSLAENGVKALAFLQESKEIDLPKLILSDIMMPEMDGYQLLEILKSKEKFRALPTIMLTARADAQDKLKALRIGVDDYILKPFEEEELLVRIQNLLSNYQVRSETTKLISEHNQSTENTSSISQEDQAWLAEVESHLQKQLSNSSYSILQLSFDIALSERQLRRRLKQLVGLSPSQYFKLIRLQNARQLLEQKRYKTVSQTAAAVGFQDTGAFSRNFTKQFGRKPSEYINT